METDNFFRCWFSGFEKGLAEMGGKDREALLEQCAIACSSSYPLGVYKAAFAKSNSLAEFLENLRESFSDFNYSVSDDGETITITYNRCACDLYTCGFVKSGLLCDCSRLSLKYNWEAVLGAGSVDVELKQSILRGDPSCVLEVRLK